jgi:predicted dehydrogenase
MTSSIIGNGFIAQKHKKAIVQMGWDFIGAHDVVPDKCEITFDSAMKADIVHICTPNVFHHQLKYVADSTKLIIEKPVAIRSDLVPNIDACVCYQRRFDTQAMEMKELCDGLRPTKIICNILVPRDPVYWECWRGEKAMSGGGALMNIGIHYLDLLQWWLGDKYTIKSASVGHFQRAIDESAHIVFDFDGTEVIFDLNARHNVRKIEFIATWEDDPAYIYNKEDATHYDVFKNFMDGIYVNPQEATKSLKMVEEIYEFAAKDGSL